MKAKHGSQLKFDFLVRNHVTLGNNCSFRLCFFCCGRAKIQLTVPLCWKIKYNREISMRLLAKLELRFLSQDVNVLCETNGE